MSAYIILIVYILLLWCVTKKGTVLYTVGNVKSEEFLCGDVIFGCFSVVCLAK